MTREQVHEEHSISTREIHDPQVFAQEMIDCLQEYVAERDPEGYYGEQMDQPYSVLWARDLLARMGLYVEPCQD